jgi:RNA polymerase sigma-70 factor (ECF subfamily)
MASARDAFDQLYQRHARLLLAFLAARVRRADLDDLNQEVWRRAWEHLPASFRGGQLRAWLYRIARNALIDHGRRKRPEALASAQELADHRDGSPEGLLIERERAEILKRCLERLDGNSATLVRLRLGGDDYVEICQTLGLNPDQAHKMFHKAKAVLKACVERALA